MTRSTIIAALYLMTISMQSTAQTNDAVLASDAADTPPQYPIAAIRRFADSFETIRQHHYQDVKDEDLINLAIHGMLQGLDPHSSYLEPNEYQNLQEHTKGEFVGLGIEIEMHEGLVRIVSPIDGSPADKAGLKSGDLIYKLDQKPVRGLKLNDAIDLMRGPVGTEISLSVIRDEQSKPKLFKLKRDVIKTASVRSEWLDKTLGYIRISNFEADTGAEIQKHLAKLNEKRLDGLLLDLRNNPGGSLDAAVTVSDSFINEGRIVYTRGRNDKHAMSFDATPGDALAGAPLVVLINEGSASASEIVAGALRDHKRALIVGTQSFGKGSVQQILPMSEGYGIKLTTALYFTPNGLSIQAQGIAPDIEIVLAEVKPINVSRLSEQSLPSHIELKENEVATISTHATTNKLINQDNQLKEAYHLLKALTLL